MCQNSHAFCKHKGIVKKIEITYYSTLTKMLGVKQIRSSYCVCELPCKTVI